MNRTRIPWDPICTWCHRDTQPRTPYSTPDPAIPGASWTVCGPGCPERPAAAVVFSYQPNWWRAAS